MTENQQKEIGKLRNKINQADRHIIYWMTITIIEAILILWLIFIVL